jgi:transcriptional regulator with XRE-family HTH domain
VPGRISPGGKAKNVFGPQLKKMRQVRGLAATEVVAQLNVLGWDVAASSYSQFEAGDRILSDLELLLILKVLKADFRDLKPNIRLPSR